MSIKTVSKPSRMEVDAAEKVLADFMDQAPDGYFRSVAADVLTAADAARNTLVDSALDAFYEIMMLESGRASERAAEAYHEISGLARECGEPAGASGIDRFEAALGDSRR